MFLENNFSDSLHQTGLEPVITFSYILEGSLDVDKLKETFESVILHFPVLSARMDSSGTALFLPKDNLGFILWTALDHNKPLSEVFTPPPTVSDQVVVSSADEMTRINFYFPRGIARITRKGAAGKDWPLIECCVQRFTGKTVIAIAANHLLTDMGGIAIIISSWTKALRGETLPEPAPYNDVFKDHLPSIVTPPAGSVILTIPRIVRYCFQSFVDSIRYGSPETRSIFIPRSIIQEWKDKERVSTNDLVTAWLYKAWASTVESKSLTVSLEIVMDLRKHLSEIVPENYLRNAVFACTSPRTLTCDEINKMSLLQLAQTIRSIINYYTPQVILNEIAYVVKHSRGLGSIPKGNLFVICSSGSKFNLHDVDFGAKIESFEVIVRADRKVANVGTVWLENHGARFRFTTNKKRWSRCML